MTVGERIKQRREELGLSQEELAIRMGYSGKSSVCKAETSGDGVTTTKISKFAKALNCTESYLMGWEDNPLTKQYVETILDEAELKPFFTMLREMPPEFRQIAYKNIKRIYEAYLDTKDIG